MSPPCIRPGRTVEPDPDWLSEEEATRLAEEDAAGYWPNNPEGACPPHWKDTPE